MASSNRKQAKAALKSIWYWTIPIPVLLCILLFLFGWNETYRYSIANIVELDSVRTSSAPTNSRAIQAARHFSEEIINGYLERLRTRVSPSFQSEFPFWEAKGISVRFVFSSVAESLLYLFRSDTNTLYVDLLPIPVQSALMHGLISLDGPVRTIDTGKLSMEAIRRAARGKGRPPGGIPTHGIVSILSGPKEAQLSLQNGLQLFDFPYKYSLGAVFGGTFKVANTAEWYVEALGSSISFDLSPDGPIIISGQSDLSWTSDPKRSPNVELGKWLGASLADSDITNLLVKSQLFRKAQADVALKPLADEILGKMARAAKDPDYSYPLWQQEQEIQKLRSKAKTMVFAVEDAYVDQLLARQPAFTTGFLFRYFRNSIEFMWQWACINLGIIVLLSIAHMTFDHLSIQLKAFVGQTIVGAAIMSINAGWIVSHKPDAVAGWYLVMPGVLWFVAFYVWFLFKWRLDTSPVTRKAGTSVGSSLQ